MVGQQVDNLTLANALRAAAIVGGIGCFALGILNFVLVEVGNPIKFMLNVYYLLFGVLCVLGELPIKKLTIHFSFLKSYLGKGLYYFFLGTITVDIDPWWRLLISLWLITTGVFFFVLACSV
mmetsp:Transcript_14092/g.26384  ORF Transcript_14092/g.26384 Transcript_14092/m.26384 type:complete len:122 (-) Transcript_14092:769-1134(-)